MATTQSVIVYIWNQTTLTSKDALGNVDHAPEFRTNLYIFMVPPSLLTLFLYK